jgi:8-oxo-dGTP pyrophosphatase MutT (NUDIX family)
MKTKVSYGIALCRYNQHKNNRIEILMIKKRFSYQFFNFVYGKYEKNNAAEMLELFNAMSCAEKIDILGLKFENMWYRIWLNKPMKRFDLADLYQNHSENPIHINKIALYNKKKNIFEHNFVKNSGKDLKGFINQSSDSNVMWEIPKGGKNPNETNLDAAIREFTEETSIKCDKYKILYDITPIVEVIHDKGITYKHYYFVAASTKDIVPKINFRNYAQISEVEDIKWVSLSDVDFLQIRHKIRLFNDVVKQYRLYNRLRPYISTGL